MTCKDCIHYDLCRSCSRIQLGWHGNSVHYVENIEEICKDFKDRSRFVELKSAEWIEDEDMYGDPIYHCSNCNEHFVLEEGTPTDNCYFYCPNCGAKMDKQALKERENNAN